MNNLKIKRILAPTATERSGAVRRMAALLLLLLATTLPASATDFITDVKVIGEKEESKFEKLLKDCEEKGWTAIKKDLNKKAGGDYIYLLYKTQSSQGNSGTPITGFYIKTGKNPPADLIHDGRTYHLVSYTGSAAFEDSQGDLNRGAGGDYIHLYYTREALQGNTAITDIDFNETQSGGLGADGSTIGYDLNENAGGNYIYMHVTTALNPMVVTLIPGSGKVQVLDGYVLTGTAGGSTQVSIVDGATVTLSGANITAIPPFDVNYPYAGISCLGDATIILKEGTTNDVKGGYYQPGIHVPENKTLTIKGSGTLNATGSYYGAGIGGSYHNSCGNITISCGIVNARGNGSPGIGCGFNQSSCGDITISGGTVTAYGSAQSAGIGSSYNNSSCRNITISGGTVTAYGGMNAAGIGSGNLNSSCGNITISNGVTMVTAKRGENCKNAIGWGVSSTCGTVIIGDELISKTEGDTRTLYPMLVTLTSKSKDVLLRDGNVLTGTGGKDTHVTIADGATVTLSAVNITAIAKDKNHEWAGISCLGDAVIILKEGTTNEVKGDYYQPGIHVPSGKALTIQGGGTLNATGDTYAAGIGGGENVSCGNITISGGTVNAYGGTGATGIGSGCDRSSCGNITISGGTVTAYGGSDAAGIGSGYAQSSCGDITISNGVTMVIAKSGENCDNAIGQGIFSTCGTVIIGDKLISKTEGDTRTLYPMLVTLTSESKDVLLRDGNVLTGTGGKDTHVTIADGATVTLSGMNITATTFDASHKWAGISCLGDAVIILNEGTTNKVKGGYTSPGIYVPKDKTLTIQGSGTLNATYGDGATAGIGSAGYQSSCGNITISGGTVNAYGGSGGAGIGSGYQSSCGDITISGGTVTAYGGTNAAGIGSGCESSCGNITITNGVTMVTARYGFGAWTAIGRGVSSTCGTVTIGEELTSKTEGNTRTLYHDAATDIRPSAVSDTQDSDDGWFTISGQRISGAPQKSGLYINAGRKVVVK